MAKPSMALSELVEKGANDDVVRELLTHVVQRLMDFEIEQRCGAGYGERTDERNNSGGGKVLIHCKAGLGRTGLLAATLLIELGATPEAAIAAVRRGRPNRIETAQENYVLTRRAAPEGSA